jgi:hypothetical protein
VNVLRGYRISSGSARQRVRWLIADIRSDLAHRAYRVIRGAWPQQDYGE